MPISINELTTGIGIKMDNEIFVVMSYQHVKPGKGVAFVRVKLKNIKTQQLIERTIKPSEKLDDIDLEERKMKNLYQSEDSVHFMDLNSYEELTVSKDVIGDEARFLQDDLEVVGVCYEGQILKVNLPTFIQTEVIDAQPGLKGDSSKAGTKPVTIDTGAIIQAPLFINKGEKIKVDTRTGEYVERVNR